jgi:hypothetical protein
MSISTAVRRKRSSCGKKFAEVEDRPENAVSFWVCISSKKEGNGSRLAIFFQPECIFAQSRNWIAGLVCDNDGNKDEVCANRKPLRVLLRSWRYLRRQKRYDYSQDQQKIEVASAWFYVHKQLRLTLAQGHTR